MAPNRPTVSVVIPAYNAERFLPRSMASVLGQTVAPLETVVVDDGSTDATAEVARRAGSLVRIIRQENAGCAAARNHGIREATGEFIAFLDADDEWYPGHLAEAVRVLAAHRHLRWFCAAREVRPVSGAGVIRKVHTRPLTEGAYFNDYFRADLRYRIAWTGVMVIQRDALLEIGGFDETMHRGSDTDGWFRIGLRYPQIGYSPRIGAVYRRRADSISGPEPAATVEELVKRLDKLEPLAAATGIDAARRSRPVLVAWARALVQAAIQAGDRDALRAVRGRYGRELGLLDLVLIPLSHVVPRVALRRFHGVRVRVRNLLRTLRNAV